MDQTQMDQTQIDQMQTEQTHNTALESRVAHLEQKVDQLTQLLAGLTQVAQQLMHANSVVVNAAHELRKQSPAMSEARQ